MSKKSRKNKKLTKNCNEQKYKWSHKKRFNNFEEADQLRGELKKEGCLVKIRRCGPAGTQFKVVIGTEIKKNKKASSEKNNAQK